MNQSSNQLVTSAKAEVVKYRAKNKPESLAQALEDLASAFLKEVNLEEAATALEEAAAVWSGIGTVRRQGSCFTTSRFYPPFSQRF